MNKFLYLEWFSKVMNSSHRNQSQMICKPSSVLCGVYFAGGHF